MSDTDVMPSSPRPIIKLRNRVSCQAVVHKTKAKSPLVWWKGDLIQFLVTQMGFLVSLNVYIESTYKRIDKTNKSSLVYRRQRAERFIAVSKENKQNFVKTQFISRFELFPLFPLSWVESHETRVTKRFDDISLPAVIRTTIRDLILKAQFATVTSDIVVT